MLKKLLQQIGIGIMSARTEEILRDSENDLDLLFKFILESNGYDPSQAKSQLNQDIFAIIENNFKTEGFFVEFGATNGIDLSNTFLLEKVFNWSGILAEPGIQWHENLKANRRASIETDCVWSETGKFLDFMELEDGEFSTIEEFSDNDDHKRSGKAFKDVKLKLFLWKICLINIMPQKK